MAKSNEHQASQYDLNRDGVVDTVDAETLAKIKEAELIDDRDKNLLHLAWLAMLAIVGITIFLLTPWVSRQRFGDRVLRRCQGVHVPKQVSRTPIGGALGVAVGDGK